jgi:hypothetical protein
MLRQRIGARLQALPRAPLTTVRNRRIEWLAAGVFDGLLDEALAGYHRIIGLHLSEVAVDGSPR